MVFQRFLDDRNGSVMPLLALAAIPLVGLIGASVDYSRAAAAQTTLQAAADSTSLAMAQNATSLTAQQLQTQGQAYFNALFVNTGATAPAVTVSYSTTSGNGQVVVGATSSVNTMFMGIMGFSQLPISAASTAAWGNSRLRVALVLDNTGSMSQGGTPNKIQALQTASHNLLSQLQAAATNDGDVYVSIIPFAKDVNVGSTNYSQTWLDFTDWDAANGSNVQSGQNCTTNRFGHKTCTPTYTWTPANHNTWNGCVTDRTQNYDTTNTAPTSGSTLFPAEQYNACPAAMVPLTYNWTTLSNEIDAMTPNGGTNQAIGLAWGWQSLTQSSPLNAPSEDPNYQYQHIVIILSDGLNTQDRWYGNGSNWSSQVDARQEIVCDNMKNAGITIYAVQVNTDNEATSSVLQYCAGSVATVGDKSKFFLLTTPNQIVTTFNQIATGLTKLRIAN